MRYLFLLIFLFFNTKAVLSQNEKSVKGLDSIQKLRSLSSDAEFSLEERLAFALSAVELSSKTKIDSVLINSNRTLSSVYLNRGEYEKYRKLNHNNLKLAKKINDSLVIGIASLNLGWYHHFNMVQNDSAYYYYSRAAKTFDEIGELDRQVTTLVNLADIQDTERDYIGAEANSIKAIKILERLPETENYLSTKWILYNLLGVINLKLELYNASLEYHNMAYDIGKKMEFGFIDQMLSLNNMAFVYRKLGNHAKALELYNTVLENKEVYNEEDPTFYPLVLENLAFTKYEAKHSDIDNIELMLKTAYKISDSLEDPITKLAVSIDLAKFYYGQKNKDSSLVYAKQAYDIGGETNSNQIWLESMQLLSKINEGEQGKAYLNQYIKLSDSLLLNERKNRNKFARIEFETDKLEEENKRISRERLWLTILSIGLLFTALLIYIIITQRARNKELKFKQDQQQANEEIYNLMLSQQDKVDEARASEKKRISEELHDGILGRLFGTRLSLDSLNFSEGKDAIKSRANYISELKTIEEDIRKVSHDLNTDFVSGSGFMDIISELIEKQTKAYQLQYDFKYTDDINWEVVPNKTKINIYRIIQETLQNIYKHAEANEVKISIELKNNVILLAIIDDGKGFEINKSKKGIGLKNINSRVNELEGSVKFYSEINKGTSVLIDIPYKS